MVRSEGRRHDAECEVKCCVRPTMHPGHNDGLSAEVQCRMRDDFAAGKPEPLPVYLALEGGRD